MCWWHRITDYKLLQRVTFKSNLHYRWSQSPVLRQGAGSTAGGADGMLENPRFWEPAERWYDGIRFPKYDRAWLLRTWREAKMGVMFVSICYNSELQHFGLNEGMLLHMLLQHFSNLREKRLNVVIKGVLCNFKSTQFTNPCHNHAHHLMHVHIHDS